METEALADLDEKTGDALSRALEQVLAIELEQPVRCKDVSRHGYRWDVEAYADGNGDLVRRVSHTRAVSEVEEMALAEIVTDITPSIEQRLAELGIRGCLVSYHAHVLPTSRQRRRKLGRLVADYVATTITRERSTSYDLMSLIAERRHAERNPIFFAFHDVSVDRVGADMPAMVLGSTDDRLWSWERSLASIIVPVIDRSVRKHRELVPDLTLVIELRHEPMTVGAVRELAAALGEEQRAFKSLYLGKLRFPAWEMELVRVY
jgi:hypothetical protein